MIYRGYDIERAQPNGYTWKDERGFEHYAESVTKTPFKTEDEAMDSVDTYRRQQGAKT